MLEVPEEVRLDDEKPCTRILKNMTQLQAARSGVDRHQAGAEPSSAEEYLDELRPILAYQCDAIASPDAGHMQATG